MMKKSSSNFLNLLLHNSDTLHFSFALVVLQAQMSLPQWFNFLLKMWKKNHYQRYIVINLPKKDFFMVQWLLLSSLYLNF